MSDGEQKKRRGRPRVSDEDRRHNTLTCRVRDDARDAVEELANTYGRTISEQIEHFIDRGIKEDAKLIYEYSSDPVPVSLSKYINSKEELEDRPPRGRILFADNPNHQDAYYASISAEYRRLRAEMINEIKLDMHRLQQELNVSLKSSMADLFRDFRSNLSVYAKVIWTLGGKKSPLLEVEKTILSDVEDLKRSRDILKSDKSSQD